MNKVADLSEYRARRAEQVQTARRRLAEMVCAVTGQPVTDQAIRALLSPRVRDEGPELDPAS